MIENIIHNPKTLTDSMQEFKDRFYEKANKIDKTTSPLEDDIDEFSVIEWENGWAQIALTENQIYVRTMFSDSGTDFKFKYLYELAKCLNKKEIIFETERNPKAWLRLFNSKNYNAIIKGYIIGIEI